MKVKKLLIKDIKELKFNIEKTKRKFKNRQLLVLKVRDMIGGMDPPSSSSSSSSSSTSVADHESASPREMSNDEVLEALLKFNAEEEKENEEKEEKGKDIYKLLFDYKPPVLRKKQGTLIELTAEYEALKKRDEKLRKDASIQGIKDNQEYQFKINKYYQKMAIFDLKTKSLTELIENTLSDLLDEEDMFGSKIPRKGKLNTIPLQFFRTVQKATDEIKEELKKKESKKQLRNFTDRLIPVHDLDVLPDSIRKIIQSFDQVFENQVKAMSPNRKEMFKLPEKILRMVDNKELTVDQFIPYKVEQDDEDDVVDLTIVPEDQKEKFKSRLRALYEIVLWVNKAIDSIVRDLHFIEGISSNQKLLRSFIDNEAEYKSAVSYVSDNEFMVELLAKYKNGISDLVNITSNEYKHRFYFLLLRTSNQEYPIQFIWMAMINQFFYTIHTVYKKIFSRIPNLNNGPLEITRFLNQDIAREMFIPRKEDFSDFNIDLQEDLFKKNNKKHTDYVKILEHLDMSRPVSVIGLNEDEEREYAESIKRKEKNRRGEDKEKRKKVTTLQKKGEEFEAAKAKVQLKRQEIVDDAAQQLADLLLVSDEDENEEIDTLVDIYADSNTDKKKLKADIKKQLKSSTYHQKKKLEKKIEKLKEYEKKLKENRSDMLDKIYGAEEAIKIRAENKFYKERFKFDFDQKLSEYRKTLKQKALKALKLRDNKKAFDIISKKIYDSNNELKEIEEQIKGKQKGKRGKKKITRKEILKKYHEFYRLQDDITKYVVQADKLSVPNKKLTIKDLQKKIHNINELYYLPKEEKTKAQIAKEEKEKKEKREKSKKDRADARKAAMANLPKSSGRVTRSQRGKGAGKEGLNLNVWIVNKKVKR